MLKTSPVLVGSAASAAVAASAANGSPASCRRRDPTPPSPPSLHPPDPSLTASSRQRPPLTSSPQNSSSGVPCHSSINTNTSTCARGASSQHENAKSKQQSSSLRASVPACPESEPRTLGTIPAPSEQAWQQIRSPNKRRVSLARSSGITTPPAPGPSRSQNRHSATYGPKRARTEQALPKVLSQQYELCAVEDIVELIAHMLAELIATNDAIRISSGGLTRFHSRTAPGISVRDYLHRLARHATLTPPLLLAMVYYIDRLCALYPEFTINTLTVHRFLITAATVASKGLSDSFWNNTTYARVGGVRLAELKLLELEFLYRVDWKIVPNPEVLVAYYQGLVERTPQYVLEHDESSAISSSNSDDDDNADADADEDEDDEDEPTYQVRENSISRALDLQ
ncbi:hypothetical protein E4U42_003796 [Claviceps africana]|uniref:Nuc-1 negative regulatory protein preg n=1 Tax=Claviceps africana TaxID=83212 RepID=A0A8K0NIK1_9HYPO|nr:hypothetical protein E4U42_003796 [Claviceps africana]